MAYYPQNATGLNAVGLPAGPTAQPSTVTPSGTNNTKGPYTQFTASLGYTCNALHVHIVRTGASQPATYLMDVATGAAASEVVVIPNIPTDNGDNATSMPGHCQTRFNLAVTSGTRIALRCQCSTGTGNSMTVAIIPVAAGGVTGQSSFTTYGVNISTSAITSIDPGGTVNMKGSYSQVTSSTSAVAQWLGIYFGHNSAAASQSVWSVDFATGAAASEVVLISDMRVAMDPGNTAIPMTRFFEFLTYIASGTRLAMRASSDNNTSTDRLIFSAVSAMVAPSEPSGGGGGAWAFA